ncbi:MAG: hypothetical protein IMF11_07215 [Proteobacteria bacterium]|nr:hypothetical protein [Pseudomonadota bacterium]
MAKRKKNSQVKDYRHDETRKNNPPIWMVSYEPKVGEPKMNRYAYDPHLSPQLVWAGKHDQYGHWRTVDIAGCAVPLLPVRTSLPHCGGGQARTQTGCTAVQTGRRLLDGRTWDDMPALAGMG